MGEILKKIYELITRVSQLVRDTDRNAADIRKANERLDEVMLCLNVLKDRHEQLERHEVQERDHLRDDFVQFSAQQNQKHESLRQDLTLILLQERNQQLERENAQLRTHQLPAKSSDNHFHTQSAEILLIAASTNENETEPD